MKRNLTVLLAMIVILVIAGVCIGTKAVKTVQAVNDQSQTQYDAIWQELGK